MTRLESRKAIVTGAAGFIGSNLVDALLHEGFQVKGIDNLSTGRKLFLEEAFKNSNFEFENIDLLKTSDLVKYMKGYEYIFHLSANADVRNGVLHTSRDLEQNTIVTQRVLEACRNAGVQNFIFASTGSVYGEARVIPTPEDAPFPLQTSLYGASKLAGEGLVTAYAESFGITCRILRFVSILGPRYTHGHVFDFYKQLLQNPNRLTVLGNGRQKKSYLHVDDCVSGILRIINSDIGKVSIYNLGTEEFCEVRDSVRWICDELQVKPEIEFGTEDRGWVGDNPFILLDIAKMSALGWTPVRNIEQSVRNTVQYFRENPWLFKS